MNDATFIRLTYLAWGQFPDEQRAIVHDQFADFHAALQADRTPEQAAEAFPPNVRQTAAQAARAVRAFEATIGQKSGAPPTYVSLPQRHGTTFAVGIPSSHGSRAASDAAAEAATALGDVLTALGAIEVDSVCMD
jgi:hypothetical protein